MDETRIESLPLFGSLSKRECRQIARIADEVELAEGFHLVNQCSFAHEFFVIEEGTAAVMRDGQHVADLGPGDFMGEMGLLDHARRNASVVATSPMTVMVMSSQDFRSMEAFAPDVAQRIQAEVEKRALALVG
jgi:CRP/FNR family transcriptional regulator, cyclic AMP receptor protein